MRDQGGGVNREGACRLDSIWEFKTQRSSEPRGTFGNLDIERNHLPGFQDCAITPRKGIVSRLQRAGKYFGDGNSGHCEAKTLGQPSFEERPKARAEFWMGFEDVDDRRGIDQDYGVFRQILEF